MAGKKGRSGRSKADIDIELMKKLAAIQCTITEMSSILGVHRDTFHERLKNDEIFSDAYNKARDTGKSSLRRMQYEAAKNGSAAMLIWLGKQFLGQIENPIEPTDDELEFI